MGTVSVFVPTSAPDLSVWFGNILQATNNRIVIDDGFRRATYEGNFSYSADGSVSGVLTNFRFSIDGVTQFSVASVSVSAASVYDAIQIRADARLAASIILAGDDDFFGSGGADRLLGLGGNDWMSGYGGNDSINGGIGNDTLFGNFGNDQLLSGTGNDVLVGGDGADRAFGGSGADRMFGGSGRDNLVGGDGNDVINGGSGIDTLDGGSGADRYQAFTLGRANADTIVFNRGQGDQIILDKSSLTSLGATVTSNEFRRGPVALDLDDRLIADSVGRLWYDADGSRVGAAQLIAVFSAGTVQFSDIVLG